MKGILFRGTRSCHRRRLYSRTLCLLCTILLTCHGTDKLAFTVVEKVICQLQLHAVDYSSSNVFDASSDDLQPDFIVTCSPVNTETGVVDSELLELEPLTNGSDALSLFRDRLLEEKELYLFVSPARIQSNVISVAAPSTVAIVERPNNVLDTATSSTPAIGTKRTLLLRVSTKDSEPSMTGSELQYHAFQSQSSLAQQMNLCSFGRLTMEPHRGGVWEVTLGNYNATNATFLTLVNAATKLVAQNQNVSSASALADTIMVILPPGTRGRWASFSTLSGTLSVYNNEWATQVSTLAHGMGHNFGLGHALKAGAPQGDQTGYMGLPSGSTDAPSKCFNAMNYWELGWAKERTEMTGDAKNASSLVHLTSIVDADGVTGGYDVVLAVENLYMSFNRAKGFNSDTGELRNSLVIVRPTAWGTQLVAGLDEYNSTFTKTLGDGSALTVELCQATEGGTDDDDGNVTAVPDDLLVSVSYNGSLCPANAPMPASVPNASQSFPSSPPSSIGGNGVNNDTETSSESKSSSSSRSLRILWISVLLLLLGLLLWLGRTVARRGRCGFAVLAPRRSYRKMDSTLRSAGDDGDASCGGASFASDSTRVRSNVSRTAVPLPASSYLHILSPSQLDARHPPLHRGAHPLSMSVNIPTPVPRAATPEADTQRYRWSQDDHSTNPQSHDIPATPTDGCVQSDWFFEEGLWGASEI